MKSLCKNCGLRDSCSTLCLIAEKYVSQDDIKKSHLELNVATIEYAKEIENEKSLCPTLLDREKIIYYYFLYRLSGRQIAKTLNMAKSTVYYHINKAKPFFLEAISSYLK